MNILRMLSVAALVITLPGCQLLQKGLTPEQQAMITQLQQGAIKACGFAPSVESGLALLGTVGNTVSTGISLLCGAVQASAPPPAPAAKTQGLLAAPSRAGQPGQVTVNGVAVSGVYTR